MKATINDVEIEGTPSEIILFARLFKPPKTSKPNGAKRRNSDNRNWTGQELLILKAGIRDGLNKHQIKKEIHLKTGRKRSIQGIHSKYYASIKDHE